jgi:hypothetical protein
VDFVAVDMGADDLIPPLQARVERRGDQRCVVWVSDDPPLRLLNN